MSETIVIDVSGAQRTKLLKEVKQLKKDFITAQQVMKRFDETVVTINLDIENRSFLRTLQESEKRLKELWQQRFIVDLEINEAVFMSMIDKAYRKINRLAMIEWTINVDTNLGSALRDLSATEASLKRLSGKKVSLEVIANQVAPSVAFAGQCLPYVVNNSAPNTLGNAASIATITAAVEGVPQFLGNRVISRLLLPVAGTVAAGVGVVDSLNTLNKASKEEDEYEKWYGRSQGYSSLGGLGLGAVLGGMVGGFPGILVGGGIGYLLGKVGGIFAADPVADYITDAPIHASTSEHAAVKVVEDSQPEFDLLQQKLMLADNDQSRLEEINAFISEMSETTAALQELAENKLENNESVPEEVLNYLSTMNYYLSLAEGMNNAAVASGLPSAITASSGSVAEEGSATIQMNITGEKKIENQIQVTAEDFGIPKSISTTTDIYLRGNVIKGSAAVPKPIYGTNGAKYRGGIVAPAFADGGYVHGGAQLITVAEEGTPEAIIPLGRHRRKRALELFGQVGSYLQAPGFSPRGFAAGGIAGGSIGSIGGAGGGAPLMVEVGGVEIKVEAKDGQSLVETIREHKEAISEEIAGVFNAAFRGQFANTPATGGVNA